MEVLNDLVEHLKARTGGSSLMTPAQLAVEIGVSEKQQSKLRKEDKSLRNYPQVDPAASKQPR